MSYELSGKVKVIQDPHTFASGFTKQELVVSVPDGNYTQDISIEFLKDKTDLLNGLKVGDEVTVFFNIRGREYNGRYFNNLTAWKLDRANDQPFVSTTQESKPAIPDDEDDFWKDVPF